MLQRASALIRAPTSTRAGALRGPAGGPWRLWERAASEGQLDAAPGYKGEGMKPPESSCYLDLATKETTVGKEDEAQSEREGRRGGGDTEEPLALAA